MAYAVIDDQLPDHPKIEAAGPLGGWLYVCGLAYCTRLLTDGFIPEARVSRLAAIPPEEVTALVTRLLTVGLWEKVDGGYRVHDFLKHNPSAAEVLAKRAAAAERQGRWRGRHLDGSIKEGENAVSNASPPRQAETPVRRVTNSSPRPSHESLSPSGEREAGAVAPDVVPPPAPTPAPKPNRYGTFIDHLAAAGVEYAQNPPDAKAVNGSPLRPDQLAEIYAAIALGQWGDDWLRDHLTAATAARSWNAYQNAKRNPGRGRAERPGRIHAGPEAVAAVLAEDYGLTDGHPFDRPGGGLGAGEARPRLPRQFPHPGGHQGAAEVVA